MSKHIAAVRLSTLSVSKKHVRLESRTNDSIREPRRITVKRGALLVALGAVLAASASAQPDFNEVDVTISKVSGSVYLLQGHGGNIGALIGEDGVVLVDTQYSQLTEKLRAALKTVTDKPVRFVINTHFHLDHVGGNSGFREEAVIIGHHNLRRHLVEGSHSTNYGSLTTVVPPSSGENLPTLTFDDEITLHLNGEEVRITRVQNAHTDGDSVVYFTNSNVVHFGDVFGPRFPFGDLSNGGSVSGTIAALSDVVARLPEDVKVIPGHGPVMNLDDVRRFSKMLSDTQSVVSQGIADGKTLEQMKEANVLAPWSSYSGTFTTEVFLETLYHDLARTENTSD